MRRPAPALAWTGRKGAAAAPGHAVTAPPDGPRCPGPPVPAGGAPCLLHGSGHRRARLAGPEDLRIGTGAWHILRLRPEGERCMAWFRDMPVFAAHDARIAGGHAPSEAPRIEVPR